MMDLPECNVPLLAWELDLTIPAHAYLFGFIQTDGHLRSETRNRGSLAIELSERDKLLLEQFQKLIPFNSTISSRKRITNFSGGKEYATVTWRVHDLKFRNQLLEKGIVSGRKSDSIRPSKYPYSEADYWRGVIDGDGSLGLTKTNLPYVSLVTASEDLKIAYLELLTRKLGNVKYPNRNVRDNVYNIVVFKEQAQKLAAYLYYPKCFGLSRKIESAVKISNWVRPGTMKIKSPGKSWTTEQDAIIMQLDSNIAAIKLNRSLNSIKTRLWRLNRKTK